MTDRIITNGEAVPFEFFVCPNKASTYVDKTALVCKLGNKRASILLTRPPRMGKSTLISTFEYLFSKGTEGTDGLACRELWTQKYRYFVFHLSFKGLSASNRDEFRAQVLSRLDKYSKYFGVTYTPDLILADCFEILVTEGVKRLSDGDFLATHPELTQGDRPLCTNETVLLIDDYDYLLNKHLDNSSVFEDIRREHYSLFAAIKDTHFRFVCITGQTPKLHLELEASMNQFIDISLYDDYAACCGYKFEDLERHFAAELERAQQGLKLESRKELFEYLKAHYESYIFVDKKDVEDKNGYLYGVDLETLRVFSPDSIARFLSDASTAAEQL